MKIKKIAVFFSRANYASIKSILIEIKNKKFKLILILGSSAIIEKYGSIIQILKKTDLDQTIYCKIKLKVQQLNQW